MKQVMGIINNANEKKFLKDITKDRSMATVPFAGRYRMIDFPLSNMVNSGINAVGILVQNNYRSLFDHVKSGKEWNLARKTDGLFILPSYREEAEPNFIKGDMQLFHSNLEFLKHSQKNLVVISSVNFACNIDYRKVVEFHRKKQADITVVVKNMGSDDTCAKGKCITVDTEANDRVADMKLNYGGSLYNHKSLDMYVISKDLLIKTIESCYAHGEYDFTIDAIVRNVKNLKCFAYEFDGYVADVNSVKSYFDLNMELLEPNKWEALFLSGGPILTKVSDKPPSKYSSSSNVSNSLVACGCKIEGHVENSVIFRGVHVKKGAVIKNSIIMQDAIVEKDVTIDYCILDKEVVITDGKKLMGDRDYPVVVDKLTVI
jgi:glucose-1-phosphate adenylyltransferase